MTFWAEPGDRAWVLRVFARGDFLPVGGAARTRRTTATGTSPVFGK